LAGGLVVILQRPFQVGDRVKVGDIYGDVVDVGPVYTRIRTLDDTAFAIPNGRFLDESVGSSNAGEITAMTTVDLLVDRSADVALARALVEDAVLTSPYANLERRRAVLAAETDWAVRIRARAYVVDFRYEMDFVTDVTERARAALRAHGIAGPALPAGEAVAGAAVSPAWS